MAAVKVWPLLKQTYREWSEDEAPRLAAALAYYTIFSLAPVLVIVVAVAGLAFGADEVRAALVGQVRGLLGEAGSDLVLTMLREAARPKDSLTAMALAFATLLFGASGLFAQLQDALNTVWDVEPQPGRGLLGLLKDRFLSFTMVLGVGFLLLVSLVLAATLQAAQAFAQGSGRRHGARLPGAGVRPRPRADHAPVRDAVQVPAGRGHPMERRLARSARHRAALHGRQVRSRARTSDGPRSAPPTVRRDRSRSS